MSRALPPPTRFTEAEKINPLQVLLDLHDHALDRAPDPTPDGALVELALVAAVVAWWSRWQPITIHAALRAGATVTDIAAATGLDNGEVVCLWTRGPKSRPGGHRWTPIRRPGRGPDHPPTHPRGGAPMSPTRIARNVSTVAVGSIAAWSSWSHIVEPRLEDATDELMALYGALQFEAAYTAARAGEAGRAWRYWDTADAVSRRLPEGLYQRWTSFSRVIMGAHAVTVEVELRKGGSALQTADRTPAALIPSRPRRARHLIEVARGHYLKRDHQATDSRLGWRCCQGR